MLGLGAFLRKDLRRLMRIACGLRPVGRLLEQVLRGPYEREKQGARLGSIQCGLCRVKVWEPLP